MIQDSSIAQALTLGGPAPPLWWERGRTAEFTAGRLHRSTLCSPTEGEALEAWMLLDRDSGWQREQWKYLTKQKLKVKTVQNLSRKIQTDPKNKTHELTLHLAEQGALRVKQRKCSLRPESRGAGRRVITRRSQKQVPVLINMFRHKRYGSKSLLPKTDGTLSLFFFPFFPSFSPFFLFAFGRLFNKRYTKSTALKMCLYDKCI